MDLKNKLNAAMERMNAGRVAKLTAKSEMAAKQGDMKKSAKLQTKALNTSLRSDYREQKKNMEPSLMKIKVKYKKP